MDLSLYYNLLRYLADVNVMDNLSLDEQRKLKLQSRHYLARDGQLYKRNRSHPERPLKVIKTTEVEAILYNMHSDPLAGHFAFDGTFQRTIARYFWPQMGEDIKNYINSCQTCQKFGGTRRKEPLHPIQVGKPYDRVGIDLVGPLPPTKNGNRYIIVMTEYLTKWPEAKPIPNKNAETIAAHFHEEIICRHGCPKELLSDQGTEFCNQIVNALCQLHGIRHTLSSAYHPQTNGLVERFNQTLCKSLAKISHERNQDWDNLIPSVLFAYRTMKHSTTRHTPFYLTYGRDATLPVEFEFPTYPSEPIDEIDNLLRHTYQLIDKLPPALNKAHQNIINSQDYSKQRHDQRISNQDPLKIGDKVWLERKQHSHKFAPKWLGPFYIHDVLQNSAYRLRRLHDGTVLPNTYHGTRLKLYKQYKALEPIIVIE
jgi:hypothetical protein